mmetsp:Transcript_74317/g.187252  ORF Transcript_74317/g.187252 Transcript_74317/m.187252 type:complete len:300 (+) Transcript_74317:110-1009(+)
MELPLEEGYVYGKTPKKPTPVPDIPALFESVGVPKGKLGELPYPKEWYDGAKERARLREIEMEELYFRKDGLRTNWVDLVLDGLDVWGQKVAARQAERGPIVGLAELLARAAHERPSEEDRIEVLMAKAAQAQADQARLRVELADAREHITQNEDQIQKREEEDAAAERERVEEKKAEMERKARAEKQLARQAALLRGEELPESEDGEGGAELAADGVENDAEVEHPVPPAEVPAATFLAEPSGSPSPELRGGLARQLPPLPPPAAGYGSGTGTGTATRGPPSRGDFGYNSGGLSPKRS